MNFNLMQSIRYGKRPLTIRQLRRLMRLAADITEDKLGFVSIPHPSMYIRDLPDGVLVYNVYTGSLKRSRDLKEEIKNLPRPCDPWARGYLVIETKPVKGIRQKLAKEKAFLCLIQKELMKAAFDI